MFAAVAVTLAVVVSAPNVVLISVDTLRADHLGFYGHVADTSPNLDRLAAKSLVFDDAVCEIPLTSPSFCAMMSSQYPRATGATRNGLRLPEEVRTTAQVFQDAGYETLCVTSNWTLKRDLSGLDRGFDVYDDDFHKKRWGLIKSERPGDEVTELALAQLAARDESKPLFAWFHYSDPHAPYKLHRKFNVSDRSLYPDDRGAGTKVKYDSEIAFTDHQIQDLLDGLPTENTFVVFVGDHGESLWEHDYLGHGRRIYQTGLRIPFMVSGPGIEAGRTDAPVRGIDVGPTLLALAGLTAPESMLGTDVTNGAVLADRVRVVETYGGAVPSVPGMKALMGDKGPQRQSVLADGWKLITDGQASELFRVRDDPGELENVASEHSERVREMLATIEAWASKIKSGAGEEADLSDDDIEALKSLGYIE